MKSIANLIFTMTDMYPTIRSVSDAVIVDRIKSAEDEIYQFLGKVIKKDITVTVDNKAVQIADDFRSDNLVKVLYYEQGTLKGSAYPDTEFDTVMDIDKLKIDEFNDYLKLPLPIKANYNVATVFYRPIPSEISEDPSTWDTTYPVIDDEYTDLLVYATIKAIALYGDCPDISINNNNERLYRDRLSKAKADWYKRRSRNKPNKQSHNKYW
jgi:hypothetical protein